MRDKTKLVYGWGINDVTYTVCKVEKVNGKSKLVWRCPYYTDWKNILQRCLSKKYQENKPTYAGCTIHEEWKYLSNFIKWVDSQPNRDWENCQLDKDLLIEGNKLYGPDTCVYITKSLNLFITNMAKNRGECMIGVVYTPHYSGKNLYRAHCSNPFTLQQEHLGAFPTELEAHLAWKAKKHEHACRLAFLQDDERVAKQLREMYSEDQDLTNK